MRISDWSSDVCSSDLLRVIPEGRTVPAEALDRIAGSYMCSRAKACVAVWPDAKRIGVLGQNAPGESLNFDFVTQNDAGHMVQGDLAKYPPGQTPGVHPETDDASAGEVGGSGLDPKESPERQ